MTVPVALLLHSHETGQLHRRHAREAVAEACRRLLRQLGVPWHVVHDALLDEAAVIRVANMDTATLEEAFARFGSLRMDPAQLAELTRRRIEEGWPADGRPLHG